MRFLLIKALIIASLTSCTLSTTKHLTAITPDVINYHNGYFSDLEKDYIYKANIEAYGHHFGGLMIIKKIKNNHHRVVFTTEFGSKMLDIELIDHNFKTNFIVDELNKKMILNTLKNDFRLILQEVHNVEKMYKNKNFIVYQSKTDKRYNFFFVNDCSRQLDSIVHASKTKEKVMVSFKNVEGQLAKELSIEHKNIKLTIDLKYVGKADKTLP